MNNDFIINSDICKWDTSPILIFFSDNVFGNLIYYSHLFPVLCFLLLATILLWENSNNLTVRWLVFTAVTFTAWSFCDLVLWSSGDPDQIMFFWSIILNFELLVYIGSFYFIYNYVFERQPGYLYQLIISIVYIPLILFSHTTLNLTGFDFTNCYREAFEGPLPTYTYAVEVLLAIGIIALGISGALTKKFRRRRKEILLATLATFLFLCSFSLGNILGTLETNWILGQYGLFGTPIFVSMLTFLIIRYNAFNMRVLSAQVFITGIFVLVISILFTRKIEYVRVVTIITALLVAILGYVLVRTVKKEVYQREQLELLTNKLEAANVRLKELDKAKSEFVSIASHQLRSPLTAIRGYASMLAEGSFGQMPVKALESAKRIEESAKLMAMSIEDYLNVSRIESGNMKYNLSDFNLLEMTSQICDDLRPEALKQNLILLFRSNVTSGAMVNADVGKVHQIIHNLINNSIKYTPKGSISVFVREDLKAKRIFIDISDTGIGMSQKTIDSLFQKFSRADNANSVNVSGTGLGLYVAVKMAEAMNGSITAHSEGDGKGSTFTFELPSAM